MEVQTDALGACSTDRRLQYQTLKSYDMQRKVIKAMGTVMPM